MVVAGVWSWKVLGVAAGAGNCPSNKKAFHRTGLAMAGFAGLGTTGTTVGMCSPKPKEHNEV